ncbi:hypothetical protein [Hymenobacter sp. CRA2]|uniref:hypothetical protein n=1 Tax=Hymenobacter sp. CRA2 TaxID=1955620 RepID=UPI00098FC343|nr:hypothetical protein [Hymenobacter sp. CRA2]OON68920.1 hypothetical protein B0919_12190 [Hymenobacter sp. CRA2]
MAATGARAQTQPAPAPPAAPAPPPQTLTLRVTLPTVVGYAIRALAKDNKEAGTTQQKTPRTNNPVLVLTLPVPELLTSKKTARAKE